MAIRDTVADVVEWIKGRKFPRYFQGLVPHDHILDDDFAKGDFRPGESYFKLRLAEMHLEYERQAWFEFLPLCLVAADYHYADQQRSMPFLVSHERLKEALAQADAGKEPIELLSTTLLGPVPFVAGDLGLAVALFRTQRSDLAELVLDVLGGLGNDLGPNPLTEALPIANHVYAGVKRLFGMGNHVQFCFGMRDEFRAGQGGGKPLTGGYLVATNASEDKLKADELWIQGGRLRKRVDGKLTGAIGHDFCLVAIEHHARRDSYANLAFNQLWGEIPKMIWDGQIERAEKYALPSLGKAIATSPDLIDIDKSTALAKYEAMFNGELERFEKQRKMRQGKTAVRGGNRSEGKGQKGGIVRLKEAASRAGKGRPQVGTVLRGLAKRLEANPDAFADPGEPGQMVDTTDQNWRRWFDAGFVETRTQLAATPVKAQDLFEGLLEETFAPPQARAG